MSLNTTYNHRATWQLLHAVNNKNIPGVRNTLRAGADPEKAVSHESAVDRAKNTGNVEALRVMIEERPAIAHKPEKADRTVTNCTPVQCLAYWGRWDLVQALVEANLITNLATEYRWPDAWQAAASGDLAMVQRLCQANPDLLNHTDENGVSLLYIASANGHLEVAQRLAGEQPALVGQANLGGAIGSLMPQLGGLAMTIGIAYTAVATIPNRNILAAQRTQPRAKTVADLFRAIEADDATELRRVIQSGVPVDAPNVRGQTPLYRILKDNKTACLSVIERYNPSYDKVLNTAFEETATAVFKAIVTDPTRRTQLSRQTRDKALSYAIDARCYMVALTLIESGAKLDQVSHPQSMKFRLVKETMLWQIVRQEIAEGTTQLAVRLLNQHAVSPNLLDKQGCPIVYYAIKNKKDAIATSLVSKGASTKQRRTKDGRIIFSHDDRLMLLQNAGLLKQYRNQIFIEKQCQRQINHARAF